MMEESLDLIKMQAQAYQCIVNIENWQKELQLTNQKIVELQQKPVEPIEKKKDV